MYINEAAATYLLCISACVFFFFFSQRRVQDSFTCTGHIKQATVTSVHFPHIDVEALVATDATAIQSPSFVSDILRADLTVFDMLLTWLWQRLAGIRFDLLQK